MATRILHQISRGPLIVIGFLIAFVNGFYDGKSKKGKVAALASDRYC